jgi:hypothetical protein
MAYPGVQNFVGYPISVGGKRVAMAPNGISGPASYTQVSNPTTGGQMVSAAAFGLKYLDYVNGGSNGTHSVVATLSSVGPATSVQLKWIVVATGAEAAASADLSASTVSVLALGE